MKKPYLHWSEPFHIEYLIDILKQGEVILGTADTIIGLFGHLTQNSFQIINSIKGRFEKPYIILISNSNEVFKFAAILPSSRIYNFIKACWPGPVTFILPVKHNLRSFISSGKSTIALRVPDHKGLQIVTSRLGGLFSTSANKAGKEVPSSISQVDDDILNAVAAIINNEQQLSLPSTILDCTQEPIKVVRKGAKSIAELECMYGEHFIDAESSNT